MEILLYQSTTTRMKATRYEAKTCLIRDVDKLRQRLAGLRNCAPYPDGGVQTEIRALIEVAENRVKVNVHPQYANLMDIFLRDMATTRTREIEQLKEQRRQDVRRRLEDDGWKEPDWTFPEFVAHKWASLVDGPQALTERAWQKLYPRLVPYLDMGWILGLYVWSDDVAPLSQRLAPSASIVVKLPHSQAHTLSTNLDHFTQVVGSESTENGLVFDTLGFRSAGRGGVEVRNVTAATIHAKIKDDNLHIQDARITKLLQLESEAGLLVGLVTLVHQEESPSPVQIDARNALGTVSIDAILEYPTHPKTTPHFDINLYSMLSPAIAHIRDPRGTNSLASGTLSTLPIIQVNVTSQYAMAQASIPVTYHGSMELSSEYAAIATNDRASGLPGRKVSWTERMGMVYRGAVEWTAGEAPRQIGMVTISTQFAIARLMLLGLMDAHTDRWYAEGTEIAYNSPVARTGIRL
ncbi:unnamed protein product [Rhizoctonia solani]|uniref:Uncharacterized protein n=1 Tax=Rhizoctonia solani TaxID=456999 RepID=A0A8H3DXL7_9AGAM|nr:unnamed protein product [Rhizoctonia solani]